MDVQKMLEILKRDYGIESKEELIPDVGTDRESLQALSDENEKR